MNVLALHRRKRQLTDTTVKEPGICKRKRDFCNTTCTYYSKRHPLAFRLPVSDFTLTTLHTDSTYRQRESKLASTCRGSEEARLVKG